MNINIDMTGNYEILPRLERPKNKPNSNPIQTQFKPKQTQLKPISNPMQSQFVERPKMNAFAWIRSFTIVFCDFLAEFTTRKGANTNPISKILMLKLMILLRTLFKKSLSLLSASQRFALDKLIRKRRSMRIKKLTVSRLVANLM
ncbi:MAG: hypothetical protein H8D56_06135 [Planctomycetes bacterium]|nr:hypothetical protein [Planctomycetota bacterium]MBL7146886.1 hypothetical protein [Phycisphaerae bacterium]